VDVPGWSISSTLSAFALSVVNSGSSSATLLLLLRVATAILLESVSSTFFGREARAKDRRRGCVYGQDRTEDDDHKSRG